MTADEQRRQILAQGLDNLLASNARSRARGVTDVVTIAADVLDAVGGEVATFALGAANVERVRAEHGDDAFRFTHLTADRPGAVRHLAGRAPSLDKYLADPAPDGYVVILVLSAGGFLLAHVSPVERTIELVIDAQFAF
jgi:hypothetical protein